MNIPNLTSKQRRAADRYIRAENAKYGKDLVEIPKEKYPTAPDNFTPPIAVYRNRRFAVQVFEVADSDILRLSVNRTAIDHRGHWLEGISWQELQDLKNQLFPEFAAVEIYPSVEDTVNVANMRHLWVMPEKLAFGWKNNSEK